ncbi:arabinan endo-1,5-alpha-L-arabinosidase [Sanguibacter suaedae]|uniref:Arabinan endo-1,5-alpha-L-arabinosidase n=1 Tax=Sanguibacter suaedae TaxID=2795737 RepID=A0A934I1N0_9MICO|nr:arabinan endo-1,5-alpha-L-arabinosidase [Sanguibacter suaedae]MBI9113929.1 arabinan endo-1,5-alpha-L-arabinosidase [Sanguibacter suaedae]
MTTTSQGGALPSTGPRPTTDAPGWSARHAHDPTVVRADDGTYVMFCTDALAGGTPEAGVHVRTSTDLVTWTWHGTALGSVPPEAREWTGAPGLWAPEVVRWSDGRFHMYYSASTFGSNTSAIGLAVADDLLGPWEVRDVVVRTRAGQDTQNAIDAAVTWDADGAPWFTYGSFFSGIHTLRLDPVTGLAAEPGDLGTCIARRPDSVEAAVEGAFVVRRRGDGDGPDRYALFVSYDSLFSTYNVRVAVSEHVTGPYVDRAGNVMTDVDLPPDEVGTRVLVGHRLTGGPTWLAPGHNSVLSIPTATGTADLMVHHVRSGDDATQHTAQLRRVVWTRSGWPAVSPEPYAGEGLSPVAPGIDLGLTSGPHLIGTWDVLDLRSTPQVTAVGPVTASQLVELASGDLTDLGADDVVVFPSRDQVTGADTLSFAGYTADGTALSGTLRTAAPGA